ncbi:MAG: hypothetical protein UY35_C0007G0006 [Candidatus Saccharibacteria bacterium GW2011_GWC2_48_9]|nr:MAG: hypothetical protein UY35_C0007G0006 [Candidatus Saccharibacteria bacterium GW2011_GWC2_48_9]HCH34660.1 hypothetical protein [Candidatus Saccharibacteria bacterium]
MSKPINPVETFFLRYNFVILIVVAATIIGVSIFLAYSTFITAADPSNAEVKSEIPTSFDQATRDKVDQLHESNDPDIRVTPPSGRINPFSE